MSLTVTGFVRYLHLIVVSEATCLLFLMSQTGLTTLTQLSKPILLFCSYPSVINKNKRPFRQYHSKLFDFFMSSLTSSCRAYIYETCVLSTYVAILFFAFADHPKFSAWFCRSPKYCVDTMSHLDLSLHG